MSQYAMDATPIGQAPHMAAYQIEEQSKVKHDGMTRRFCTLTPGCRLADGHDESRRCER